MRGVVKFFNPEKLYGFIERADGEKDIFFHQDAVSDGAKLRVNDLVSGREPGRQGEGE
jgi:cold shock CspA family protein